MAGRAPISGLLARLGLSIGTSGASVTVGPRPASPEDEFQDLLVARQDPDGVV